MPTQEGQIIKHQAVNNIKYLSTKYAARAIIVAVMSARYNDPYRLPGFLAAQISGAVGSTYPP